MEARFRLELEAAKEQHDLLSAQVEEQRQKLGQVMDATSEEALASAPAAVARVPPRACLAAGGA